MSAAGSILPCQLPLGQVWKLGMSRQCCLRGNDFQQWRVDRPWAGNPLAGRNGCGVPNDRHDVPMAPRLSAQDAEAIFAL